jgi:hypothetical protein
MQQPIFLPLIAQLNADFYYKRLGYGLIQQSLNRTNPNSDGNGYARCETLRAAAISEALAGISVASSKVEYALLLPL